MTRSETLADMMRNYRGVRPADCRDDRRAALTAAERRNEILATNLYWPPGCMDGQTPEAAESYARFRALPASARAALSAWLTRNVYGGRYYKQRRSGAWDGVLWHKGVPIAMWVNFDAGLASLTLPAPGAPRTVTDLLDAMPTSFVDRAERPPIPFVRWVTLGWAGRAATEKA